MSGDIARDRLAGFALLCPRDEVGHQKHTQQKSYKKTYPCAKSKIAKNIDIKIRIQVVKHDNLLIWCVLVNVNMLMIR